MYREICKKAGILEFDNTINIFASIIKAIKQKALMKICAPSGCGKTTALKALSLSVKQMQIVTAYDGISKKELLEEVASAIGIKALPKSAKELLRNIKRELSIANKVIVIDEANFLNEGSLEQLRHIHDMCDVCIVLVGTEKLDLIIAKSHQQVETRIRKSMPVNRVDVEEVAMILDECEIKLDEKQIAKLWKKCVNLREIKYWCDDFIEVYKGDVKRFEESLRGIL